MLRLTTLVLLALMAQQAPTNTALVVGRVLDQTDGKPVAGAMVDIVSEAVLSGAAVSTSVPRRQMTDSLGRFVFRELAGGSYFVRVSYGGTGFSPNGFISSGLGFTIGAYLDGGYGQRRPGGALQPMLLADGQAVPDLVIQLWRSAAISGTVLDDTGEPVVDTVIGAAQLSSDGRLINGPTVRTDDRGMYRISGLSPGRYVVFVPQTLTAMSVESADDAMRRVAELAAAKDPGKPVVPVPELTGIRVGASLVKTESKGLIDGNIMPRRSGDALFVFQTTFYPSAQTLGSAAPVELAAGDDRSGINVAMQPVRAAAVSGTVLSGGAPAGGVRLRLAPASATADMSLFETAVAQTDGLGRFTFPLVPVGNYTVLSTNDPLPARPASAPIVHSPTGAGGPGAWLRESIGVGPEGVKDLVLTLKPGFTVRGQLEFAGTTPPPPPADIAKITVGLRDAQPRARSGYGSGAGTASADTGAFNVIGIPPGRYVLRLQTTVALPWRIQSVLVGGREVHDIPFDVSEDLNNVRVVFTDRAAGVSGKVTLAEPGDAAAAVLLFPADKSLWPDARAMTRRFRIARTTVTGDFNVVDVPPGDYLAVAVLDVETASWPDLAFLTKLFPGATSVRIGAGERPTLSLTVKKMQ
jgi:hypothetical protein